MYYNNQELYKVSVSTGNTQVWFGMVAGSEVVCSYGVLGGKLQTDSYFAESKNMGRSNETTPEQQATAELQAKYTDKVTNGHYFTSEIEANKKSEVCRIPRKVTNWKDKKHLHEDTVMLSSTKLNGSRACVVSGSLYSKIGRKETLKVKHLQEALNQLNERYPTACYFDAEIYAHGLSLQRIRAAFLKPSRTDKEIVAVARKLLKAIGSSDTIKNVKEAVNVLGYNPNDDADKLMFYVFDIPTDTGINFLERLELMKDLEVKVNTLGSTSFMFEYPVETKNNQERLTLRNKVVDKGYEGLVHYLTGGVYEYGKRSTNTLKDKPRYDAEALVTGVEVCKNGEGKLLLKACDSLSGVTFKAMMKGTRESRDYKVQQGFIGQWVTFQYEELSDAGVPTKPTVHETRLCDKKGQPLE